MREESIAVLLSPFKSLRAKLVIAFLVLMLIPMSEIALYGHFVTRDTLFDQAIERSIHQVHLQADSIVSSLQQAQGDALYLSRLRSLRMLNEQEARGADAHTLESWRSEAAQDFLVLLSVRPMYLRMHFLDSDGGGVVSVESDGETVNIVQQPGDFSENAYFRDIAALPDGSIHIATLALNGAPPPVNTSAIPVTSSAATQPADRLTEPPAVINPLPSRTEMTPVMRYGFKLADGSGVVMIDMYAAWILRNLPHATTGDTWAVVDHEGHYLVYPEDFNLVRHDRAIYSAPLHNGLMGSYETDTSVYVYDTIYPVPTDSNRYWVIYRETPKAVLYADVFDFYAMAMLFIFGAVMLAVVLALVGSQWIAQPIIGLEQMAMEFGAGGPPPELPRRVPDDEIGALTRTFCEMAQELDRKRQIERRLIERLIRAQEEERKLVAYDLHDGLIQQMVGARLYLAECQSICKINANPEHSATFDGMKRGCDALSEAIVEGRRIIEGLRPGALDDLGLVAAVEELAQSVAHATGWTLELDLQALPTDPDKTVSVTLYRIAQEALNNARKHARASHLRISMHNGNGIEMMIEDDGVGFDMASVEGRGLGITTLHERAALLKGQCILSSTPGLGTTVHVWVPVDGVADEPPPVFARANSHNRERLPFVALVDVM